ncbi:MAG TPA: enoyl-CoA hydratase-related protein [Candidatus Dormibacteraeota bacterium]|nr:enoyl-CoA hydratase-related protein [Candidatus Dormibacteraeota bacterium]
MRTVSAAMAREGSNVSAERVGPVALVTLLRSQALNVLSVGMTAALTDIFERLSQDTAVRVVIVRAQEGRAFCAGADLKEVRGMSQKALTARREGIRRMLRAVRQLPQPSIASVFGFALGGGCELALSCDLVVAAEDAEFGFPELRVGAIPGGGGTRLLREAIGARRSTELLFTARRVDAGEAYHLGLASRVVPRSELDGTSMEIALKICLASPTALRITKRVMHGSTGCDELAAEALEDQGWTEASRTPDYVEGLTAFAEKRPPRWTDR